MDVFNVNERAAGLTEAWRSVVLGQVGTATVKVLRMDGRELEPEVHGTAEVLFVAEGVLELDVDREELTVGPGGLCQVPAGARHAVRAGSRGTLLIVEVPDQKGG
ncbi:cupin domain-containing protein [Kitasatospora sp. NPDC101155]|uniref:cupin domain-containing protein n=1 Tax=Kitasatospora sp. NPDC101155 TaxID=3364097 RepID=UPI003818ADC6